MRQRPPRSPLRSIAALAIVAVLAAYLWSLRGAGPEGDGAAPGAPRLPRDFPGTVRAAGAPVAGARVRLYEDVAGGYAAEGRTAEDGSFRLSWTPTLAVDTGALYVAAWDEEGRYARTIAPASPFGTTVDLADAAEVRGLVVDASGIPVAGARVTVAVRHSFEEASLTETDGDGRFLSPSPVPRGGALDVLVRSPGRAARAERGYRGGEPITVHVAPARDVWLRVVDPSGRPVPGARGRLAVPKAVAAAAPFALAGEDGRILLDGASDGSHVGVDIEAQGFLPAEAPAWPGLATEVILWPEREVEVIAWDAWNSKGIEGVHFDVDPLPVRGEEWWGRDPAGTGRPVPIRPGATAGSYLARLPRCPVTLNLAAPGYGDGTGDVAADAERATIRLQPPMSRDKPALLRLRAPAETPPMDLIVADEAGGGYLRQVALRGGTADVVVPPGIRLQVGSGAAVEGVFLPKHVTPPLRPGEQKVLRIGTRPARRLRVTTEPAVDGEATLVATELARYVPPIEAPVRGGRVEFWVAPFRKFHLEIAPPPGFFPHEADLETQTEDVELDLHLQPAARLLYRVTDAAGNAVPFARMLVYEPGAAGRMALERTPREATADAQGLVRFDALRAGDAAVEVGAGLFRSQRSIVRLPAEGVVDGGTLELEPAGLLSGTVTDAEGSPVVRAQIRVLPPRISWLPLPGGGTRELFDLTESSLGDVVTDEEGRFSVPDRSPGPPLIAVYPPNATNLAPMAFEPGEPHVLRPCAYVELELPSSPEGVYLLIGPGKALLVKIDTPLSLRPLPLVLPAGRSSLFAKLRDWRWAAKELDLKAGETIRLKLDWRR